MHYEDINIFFFDNDKSCMKSLYENQRGNNLKQRCPLERFKPPHCTLGFVRYLEVMEPLLTSLRSSFRRVPPAAIPPMLDCILASTAEAPSSIFSTLLDEFPQPIQVHLLILTSTQ